MEHLSGEINLEKISTNIAKKAVFEWSYRSRFHADNNAISLLANPAMRQDASLGKAVKAAATNEKESIETIMTIIKWSNTVFHGRAFRRVVAGAQPFGYLIYREEKRGEVSCPMRQ